LCSYKADRPTRSLADFVIETFDKHEVSFVSVTQFFNTAQFEREVIGERITAGLQEHRQYPMLKSDDSSHAAEREENAGLGRQFAVTFHPLNSMTGTFSALHRKAGAA
jgi:DNA invertase Pin-like site-specific DNA recombinase